MTSHADRLTRVFPIIGFIRRSDRKTLRADLIAGLTVAVMVVPQSMAYASLAGMPPVTGLYSAVVPLLVYALLGTSGSLAVGPVAITALMTSAALAPLAAGDPQRYMVLAGLLAILVGGVQLLLGLVRGGVLVGFLSHSVLTGFTSAAAIVIAGSQVKDLLGLSASRAEDFPTIVTSAASTIDTTQWLTTTIGLVSILSLVALRRLAPRLPGALLVVIGVTAVSALAAFGTHGVAILKVVPGGLPAPVLPLLSLGDVVSLLPSAMVIAIVAYMEGIAVAKALAAKSGGHVVANQELLAVGAANVAAGVFQAFPVAGGFSRSAVNFQAGARTPVASVVTAVAVAVTALVLTPLFFHLPKAVLAAIVVVAVLGLVDLRAAGNAWRVRRVDGVAVALTFLVTLLLGVEPGLAAGVVFSLGAFLWRSARPHTAELGRVPGTSLYRSTARAGVLSDPSLLIQRLDGPLFFGNAEMLEDRMLTAVAQRRPLRAVILDASAISDVDSEGVLVLDRMRRRLWDDNDVELHLATVRAPVREMLVLGGVWAGFADTGAAHQDVCAAVAALDLEAESPLRRRQDEPGADLARIY